MSEIEIVHDVDVKLMQSMGGDSSVVASARVSTQGVDSTEDFDSAEGSGLINFLMANRHGTPFEHNSMTFFIRAPIFVFREFHRHSVGWSYNEESGRYKELDPVFYLPYEGRPIKQIGKPGHYEFVGGDEFEEMLVRKSHTEVLTKAYEQYQVLLDAGIAKEVARMTLPVNICSSMYATCNARSLMSFLSLRTKDDNSTFKSYPQREIEMVAEKMEAEFAKLFPITHDRFVANGRVSP